MYHATIAATNLFQVNEAAYVAALDRAHTRALHSYFTQYILTDDEAGYIALDEGDYGALPTYLEGRVIEAVPGQLADDY